MGTLTVLDAVRVLYIAVVVVVVAVSGGFEPLLLMSVAGAVAVRWLHLPPGMDAGVLAALLLTGLSSGLKLYDSFGFYDHLVHFLVFVLITPALYCVIARFGAVAAPADFRGGERRVGVALLMLGLALNGGAVWELFEFASDSLAGTTFQRGNSDTMVDLIVDALGGAAAALVWSGPRLAGLSAHQS